jgi:3-keto-5-aminohexanoate cleavage enzyme
MAKDKVNWDYIEEWKKNEKGDLKLIGVPFGLPEFMDLTGTKYGLDVEIQPAWDIPKKVFICQAIVGAFISKRSNPNQPITPEEIRNQALACLEAGAPNVHFHVRDKDGYNILDPELFHSVIDPIREKYPDRIVCGCLVADRPGQWPKLEQCLKDGLVDQTPINTFATYVGDTGVLKPPHVMIEKTRLCQEYGVKPQIAVYSDGDIDNADRYLIKTGLIKKPSYWIILPALPGCSPMHNPKAMVEGLMHFVNRIKEIDEGSEIVVCAAGRASSYLATFALLLGLDIRVGMEDTAWMWPHRNDLIKNNVEVFKMFKQLIELLGREIISPDEFRKKVGMKKQGKQK